jgi:hypothetical protein
MIHYIKSVVDRKSNRCTLCGIDLKYLRGLHRWPYFFSDNNYEPCPACDVLLDSHIDNGGSHPEDLIARVIEQDQYGEKDEHF